MQVQHSSAALKIYNHNHNDNHNHSHNHCHNHNNPSHNACAHSVRTLPQLLTSTAIQPLPNSL
jgi:hypothetical protein